jgi:hypothetical protein
MCYFILTKKQTMKKLVLLTVISLILNFSFLIDNCMSQWQPDVRLTNDPAASYTSINNAWCVASSGLFVHVVWFDNRDGNAEIYYKRSTDAGVSWGADTRLTNNIAKSDFPSVKVSSSVVHVVWRDLRDENYEIYYKRSTDAGVSWGADTRLTINNSWSISPSVAVSGSIVHIVWEEYRDGSSEIYYKRSTNAGISWGADTRLTNYIDASEFPTIAVSDSVVHIAWRDYRNLNWEIYYKRSTDGGVSWGADIRLTNNTAQSVYPSVAVSGSTVHVVWYDSPAENDEIYYKRSTDAGISWGTDIRLTNNADISLYPSVAVSSSVVHVMWCDYRDGNWEIYYKRSIDAGLSWGADTRLTNYSSDSYRPSVAVSGTVVHVVWQDSRDGNYEIYYKRDPTGNPTGIKNITSEIPSSYSLEQNYPNPFNSMTNVKFQISNSGNVKIIVFDLLGKEIATLVNEQLAPGTYEVTFDGNNLTSGIYFYRLQTEEFINTKRMILLK